jgi:hypothetical protein
MANDVDSDSDDSDQSDLFPDPIEVTYAGITVTFGPPQDLNDDGIYADVTGDDNVSVFDAAAHAVVVSAAEGGFAAFSDEQAAALDVDENGSLDYRDAYALLALAFDGEIPDTGENMSAEPEDNEGEETEETEENETGENQLDDADDEPSEEGSETDEDAEDAEDDGDTLYENATAVDSLFDIPNDAIGDDGEADVYAFELNEGAQVEIGQGIGGGALPVTLIDNEGDVLGRIADQDVFESGESTLVANASYTGTYYLKVDGEAGDEYSILQSVTEPDGNEPNDELDTATETEVGELNQGTITRGDRDVYAIELGENQQVAVEANGSASAVVAALGVDGPAFPDDLRGSEDAVEPILYPGGIEESEGGDTTLFTYNATEDPGTYYFVVRMENDVSGNINGNYNLTFVDQGDASEGDDTDADDDDESDDTPTGATALGLGEVASDTVGPDDEVDYYAVDLDAGEEITATGTDEASDTTLTAYEPANGEDVDGSDLDGIDSGGLTITEETLVEFTAEEDGTYYFAVTDDETDGDEPVDAYEFTVTAADEEPSDDSDSNESDSEDAESDSVSDGAESASVGGGPGDDLNCEDFDSVEAAQENADETDDENNLDGDDDGEACESGVDG